MRLNLLGSVCDPTNPIGRLLFIALGMVAEFESDLIRTRTREGMATAKVWGSSRRKASRATYPFRATASAPLPGSLLEWPTSTT